MIANGDWVESALSDSLGSIKRDLQGMSMSDDGHVIGMECRRGPMPTPTPRKRIDFWPALALVIAVVVPLFFYRLSTLPWDHDEVAGLIEVGASDLSVSGAPTIQMEKMSKLVPVWWATQRSFVAIFSASEFGSRVLSASCGILIVLTAFVVGWRWQGPSFAAGLALAVGMSQGLVWLSQHNRFYSQSLLFLTWSMIALWWPPGRNWVVLGVCILLAVAAVLCHNLLVVIYLISFIAALICWVLGIVSRRVALRAFFMAAVSLGIYLFYLRPILAGWLSGNTGGANSTISYVALIGVPTVALALIGAGFVIDNGLRDGALAWCVVSAIGGFAFIALAPQLMGNWNPRYAILFAVPPWVLAAHGISSISLLLHNRFARYAWYFAVVMLLLPKLASHWQDGSRHDFRSAAAVVAERVRGVDPILTNWPMELAYYLPTGLRGQVVAWQYEERLPKRSAYIVYASNAFLPILTLSDRPCEVIAEYSARRYDEQSHCIRIYRIGPANSP